MLTLLLLALLPATAAAQTQTATVTVLATTDMHGYIYPYDYYTRQPAARGLAAAATLIEQVRRETPHAAGLGGREHRTSAHKPTIIHGHGRIQ